MKCGDVVRFRTPKVDKRTRRKKYHLCISLSDGLFLFINSNPFIGSFDLDDADWPDRPSTAGHVSCNSTVRYTTAELKRMSITSAGRLTDDALHRLMDHVNGSEVLPEHEIDDVVNALASYLLG